jgi:hypothetical protein
VEGEKLWKWEGEKVWVGGRGMERGEDVGRGKKMLDQQDKLTFPSFHSVLLFINGVVIFFWGRLKNQHTQYVVFL